MKLFILLLASILLLPAVLPARIVQVPQDYATIQEGIDAAADGDTVRVAEGIYTGTGNKNLDYNGKAISTKTPSSSPFPFMDSNASCDPIPPVSIGATRRSRTRSTTGTLCGPTGFPTARDPTWGPTGDRKM